MVDKISSHKVDKFSLSEVQGQPKPEDFKKVMGLGGSKNDDDAYKIAYQATERSMFEALSAQLQTLGKQKSSDDDN